MRRNRFISAAVLAVPVFFTAGTYATAHASGYAVFTHGASALGQGNAVTAHLDDPSAVFYNPALITKLPGTQLEGGSTAIFTSREFRNTAGAEYHASSTVNFPSHLYVTSKLSDNLSAGFGVFNPFGLQSKWGGNWQGRFITTKSQLTTYNLNPTIAYRVTPSLSVAAGVDVMILDAKLENAATTFKGDGKGVGYNVGVAYDVNKDLSLGVSYRSEIEVDVDGTSSSSINPLWNSGGRSELRLPQQLTAGIAYRVIDPLIVEVGLRWEGWSAFQSLQIDLDNGAPLPRSERQWDDALGCNIGAKYRLNDTVSVSGGYIFGSNPIPDSTFDPTIPDSDTHIFTVGTDLDYKKYRISLAYAYQRLDDREKNNTVGTVPAAPLETRANGTYKTDAHMLAASFVYRF